MRPALASLLVLLLTTALPAQTVEAPAEVRTAPGRLAVLAPKTDCPQLRFVLLDAGPAVLSDPTQAALRCDTPGRYRVAVYGARGNVPSNLAVVALVVDGQPLPPPPGPTPPPVPPPPAPDQLAADLKAAYAQEPAADKAAQVRALAGVYRTGAALASDTSLTTHGDLFGRMSALAEAAGAKGKLPGVQKVIGAALAGTDTAPGILPTDPAQALDEATRKAAAEALARVARLLEALP